MTEALLSKWNQKYSRSSPQLPKPSKILKDFVHLLPARGTALDVACGMGGNALFLAEQGLDALALDFSSVAIDKLRSFASRRNLEIQCMVQDVHAFDWAEKRFDVIVISRFLDRSLASSIIAGLKPGGLLFYQTFTQEKVSDSGPSNPSYLLAENELLTLFQPLRLLVYREEGRVGDKTNRFEERSIVDRSTSTPTPGPG